ncbi:hypothetical protein CTI12_AA302710 [Artemisia annua]|uniref:Uncharacterized protein n=1 Tax=Artemisia annua TaxID=35608 RepID=A0A2U1N6H6_ARTAN|nr:hypothetical protein CTI12_AA302710 [Artemisia annua]
MAGDDSSVAKTTLGLTLPSQLDPPKSLFDIVIYMAGFGPVQSDQLHRAQSPTGAQNNVQCCSSTLQRPNCILNPVYFVFLVTLKNSLYL